eukprot:gene991-401_t
MNSTCTDAAVHNPFAVTKLLLADPWGVPPKDRDEYTTKLPASTKALATFLSNFNPLAAVRFPVIGRQVVLRWRADLGRTFSKQ